MKYGVAEFAVDGDRCEVASYVPIDFRNNLCRELAAIKPAFMLAEWEERDFHREAFDMICGWSWSGPARAVALGQATAPALLDFYVRTGESQLQLLGRDNASSYRFDWSGNETEKKAGYPRLV